MKAKLLTISAAVMALLAVSCQREETGFGLPAGEEVTVTLSASVPTGGPAVKSDTELGNGDQINRCILGVYMVTGENTTEQYGTLEYVEVTGSTATFEDVTLLTGYDYKLVFWADNVASTTNLQTDNHYVTTDFPKVTYNTSGQYKSSDDTRDAFYGVFDLTDFSGEVWDSYTLTRPFGQLNIFTTDYDYIKMEALKPAKVQMAFTSIPTGMNLISGTLTEPAADAGGVTGEISAIPDGITSPVVTGAQQLSFDYIFAPKGQQRMISGITMRFYDKDCNGLDITPYSFPELPVQANYRTNVSGALLTKSADLKIDISEDFDGTLEKDVYTVSTLAEAKQILNYIASSASPQPEIISITVEDQILSTGGQNSIELPAITTEVELNLQGGIASGATFTVEDIMKDSDSGNDFTGRLVLNNASAEQQGSLVINLPKGSAEVAGGHYTSVQVTTADDTFVLGEGGNIETLTVNGGNVEIYGRVGSIDFKSEDSYVKKYTVYDAEAFGYAASLIPLNRCASIVLGDDIDLKGSAENKWTPIDAENTRFTELDGAGYTLSNLYVDNFTGNENVDPYYYGGLFYVLQGDVRNLTIKDANVTCFRGGVLVGRMDYGTVENCHVLSSEVTSFQKIGGIVGFVQFNSQDIKILNCSVDEFSVKSISSAIYSAGGLIGFLQTGDRNVLVEGCSVSNITLEEVYESKAEDKIWDLEQYYSHPFIGDICNFSKNENSYDTYTVELRNNTVDRQMTDIPVSDRPNDYTGWWAGYFNTTGYKFTPKLIIEGQVMDRWVEMKRLAAQLMSGGNVMIWRPYDFTLSGNPFIDKKLEIRKQLNITLKPDAEVKVVKQQVQNYSALTITGESKIGDNGVVCTGTMTGTDYLIYNNSGATLTIDGGIYKSDQATDNSEDRNGVAIYNLGTCVINEGTFDALGYAVMNISKGGDTRLTVNGGTFLNNGKTPDPSYTIPGYAIQTAGKKAVLQINGGTIDGISIVNGATATITGNETIIYNDCHYYAVYIGRDVPSYNYPNVTIEGGYFSGYENMPDVYNGAGADGGNLTITGGFFRDNQATLPEGYEYQSNVQTINGITYNYEVVKTN